jgi:hypothetical protein
MTAYEPVRYCPGDREVKLVDRVTARVFFFIKKSGRVSYIPGVSDLHPEMEHDGIRLVGISFSGGGAGGFWVDSSSGRLEKRVRFVSRDSSPFPPLPSPETWI